jgi:hypothetical protein
MRGRLRNGQAGSGRGGRRQRSRRTGCLLWILVLFLVVIILGLLFGGFRKGTKTGSGGLRAPVSALRAEGPRAPAGMTRSGSPASRAMLAAALTVT